MQKAVYPFVHLSLERSFPSNLWLYSACSAGLKQQPEANIFDPVAERRCNKEQTVGVSKLNTQEPRCLEYAEKEGFEVVELLTDDKSRGGDFLRKIGTESILQVVSQSDDYASYLMT